MVNGSRTFRAAGVPRWVGLPFAGMGTFFFGFSVGQLLGIPLMKLEGNLWVGVVLGGIFAAVGWGILLQGTKLVVEVAERTYLLHTGLLIFGKTREGTWEDFGLVEVRREHRDAAKGRTYFVWCVRLRWKEASRAAYEMAAFTEGREEKGAREKARHFADDVAGLLGVMILDETGSEAVVREAGEEVAGLATAGAGVDAGSLPANSRVTVLQDDVQALRVRWRPERGVNEVLPLVVPMGMLMFFGMGIGRVGRAAWGGFFGPGQHMPVFFMLFFGVIVVGMAAAVFGGIGFVGGVVVFKVAGSSEVTMDGETLGYVVRIFGRTVRARTVALGEVAEVVSREVAGRRSVIVIETAGKDLKMAADVSGEDRRWLMRKVRGRVLQGRGVGRLGG